MIFVSNEDFCFGSKFFIGDLIQKFLRTRKRCPEGKEAL